MSTYVFSSRRHQFALACLLCLCTTIGQYHIVRADGGAPNLAYVSGTAQGISIIDIAQQKVTGTIATPTSPQSVLLSVDGRYLFVTQPLRNQFLALSARSGKTICSVTLPGAPSLLALDPIANVLYVAGNAANRVTALDGLTCRIERVFATGEAVYGVALALANTNLPAGKNNQLWVATTHALEVFESDTGGLLASIPFPQEPQFLSIPPGPTAYATTRRGSIAAIDLKRHSILDLLSGGSYGPMDFNEQTGEIFVPDLKNKRLLVLAPVTIGSPLPQEPGRVIACSAAPISVAITSDGQLGFVALSNGTVSMLDLPGRQTISTLTVGGSPHFLVTGLYPPLVGLIPQEATPLGTLVQYGAYTILFLFIFVPPVYFWLSARKKRARN